MKLKVWREWKGMTYLELAKKLGISRSFAFKITAGMHFPKAKTIVKIERLTDGMVSADDLLKGMQPDE